MPRSTDKGISAYSEAVRQSQAGIRSTKIGKLFLAESLRESVSTYVTMWYLKVMDIETEICLVEASSLLRAAAIIAEGGVVAFPTDTVYGLGCDLFNARAVERIFSIKGRPERMPLIAMFSTHEQWTLVASALPDCARDLIARWWPGPLTLIAPARSEVPEQVLGGGATIGMRIPDHSDALALLVLFGRPLATTSANLSGMAPVCSALEVQEQLRGKIELILDGGISPCGMASTVLDCTCAPPVILREGPLTRDDLKL